jgi:hypothetical protein
MEWSPSRIIRWAAKIGPHCAKVTEQIIGSRQHPEQGYRACLGIIRLSRAYSFSRVEAACRRALLLQVGSYQSIKSILKSGKDQEPLPIEVPPASSCSIHHQNVRGPEYYARQQRAEELTMVQEGGGMSI